MDIQVEVKLQVCIEKTETGYTASCERLGIYAEASSKKKAEKSIRDALSLFLETCMEMGTFHEVLTSSGFKHSVTRRKKPGAEMVCENMRVPVELLASKHGKQAYAC